MVSKKHIVKCLMSDIQLHQVPSLLLLQKICIMVIPNKPNSHFPLLFSLRTPVASPMANPATAPPSWASSAIWSLIQRRSGRRLRWRMRPRRRFKRYQYVKHYCTFNDIRESQPQKLNLMYFKDRMKILYSLNFTLHAVYTSTSYA